MNPILRVIRKNSWVARNQQFIIIFLNGFLLALLLYFFVEKQYENKVFASMASYIKKSLVSPASATSHQQIAKDSLLISSLHLVHKIGKDRLEVFGENHVKGIKGAVLQPITVDLMTAQGACGSHAYMLARLLQELGVDVRIPQMTVSGQSAGHIIVEARLGNDWVVLDPLSDAYFKKPDGQLAGFMDIRGNWEYYRKQVPVNYNMAYRYEGVRYTNWDKIPLVMPLIKNVMYWTMGKSETDSYSLRTLALRKYNLFFNITLGLYVLITLFTVNLVIKLRRKQVIARKSILPVEERPAMPA